MIVWFNNNKLERMWEEADMTYFQNIILSSTRAHEKYNSLSLVSDAKQGPLKYKANMFSTWHLVFLLFIPPKHSLNLGKCDTKWWSQHSVVSTVTRLWTGQPGFKSWQVEEIYHFSKTYRLALGPTRTGNKANHLPLSSAEARIEGTYNSTSPIRFHGIYRDNFVWQKMTILLTLLRLYALNDSIIHE